MKNSLRIHKWTHNEFNIFILGVLTHPRLGSNGKTFWPKSRRRCCKKSKGYPFSALNAPAREC